MSERLRWRNVGYADAASNFPQAARVQGNRVKTFRSDIYSH